MKYAEIPTEVPAVAPKKTFANLSESDKTKLISNISSLLQRSQMANSLGQSFDGARDLYSVLGYKKILKFSDYLDAYDRGDVASRIVDAPAEAVWRRSPRIMDDKDPKTFTEFEIAWATLVKDRKIYHYLSRADKISGVGQYGVILLGTSDLRNEKDLAAPMANKLKPGRKGLIYLKPYMEDSATIEDFVTDPTSDHFLLPEFYNIATSEGELGKLSTTKVHWTRVIHIAEGLREDDVYGTPRLKKVYNRLMDLDKVAGGSSEIFWQSAKRIMVLVARQDYNAVDNDDDLTEMMEELIHGLRRTIDLHGYDIKTLDIDQIQPRETFDVTVALISAATGIPQRILFGSEQGKLASEQDEGNWNSRMKERQHNFAEAVILRPLIDRLISTKILPMPKQAYTVEWPSLFETSDKQKAAVGVMRARAILSYVGRNGENLTASQKVMDINEFRREILNVSARSEETQSKTPPELDSTGVVDTDDPDV